MKKTKENIRYIYKAILRSLVLWLFVSGLTFLSGSEALAADLTVQNHVTSDTFRYSDAQIVYVIDGATVTDAPPGLILSNGAAVGPFKEVFEAKLGATTDYVEGRTSFTVAYGPHTIKMTLGNTEAVVNGIKCTMNNAPFVYSFDNSAEKHLYVPTRFVAETFGYEYTWNESSASVSMKRSNAIYDGTTKIKYSGTMPTFQLNGQKISTTFPGYIFDDTVFFPAEECFKATGMASFAYAEGSGLILLKNGNRLVRLVLDSPVAYINNDSCLLKSVPRLITPADSTKAMVYIPAEFVAEALGFQATYIEATGKFCVTGNLTEKVPSVSIKPEISAVIAPDTSSYNNLLFSYNTHEQIISHFSGVGQVVPQQISAYSCLSSDALYLKGINESQIKITDKADVIEIDIANCHNPYNEKFNFNQNATFLNYFYIKGSNSLKLIIIKTAELHYYTYSAPDGCVIHFTDVYGMYQDALKFSGSSGSDASDNTDIFAGEDISSYLPKAVFSRDYFLIKLPDNIDYSAITDSDDYAKKRFTISIPGNHMRFISEQDTYDPVKTLSSVQFSYKVSDDTTVLTFNTTKIQGYTYTIADGFLAVKIADPKEIYDKIIVLDAGHGGIDPGTLRGSVYEKDVNFNVINVYAPEYFENSDIKVYYTRTTDTKIALQTRADFAATVGADLFISFHVNAHSNSAVNGTGVYYSTSNNKTTASGLRSSILATTVVNRLSSAWGTSNKGILADRFVVIHNNTVPAVLVECGFITNNKDFEKIKDATYQRKAAKAIFDAVSEIFEKYPTNR